MAYTLVIVKDSRELRDARVAREKAKLELAKNPEVLEELNPVTDLHDDDDDNDNGDEHTAKEKKTKGLKALFDLSNIKDGLRAVLRERPHHKRAFLLLMILIFEIEIFLIVSESLVSWILLVNFCILDGQVVQHVSVLQEENEVDNH